MSMALEGELRHVHAHWNCATCHALRFLTSSYLQYKAATDAVASWLATTTKGCGYAIDMPTIGSSFAKRTSDGPSKRLQGKSRKLAKDTHPEHALECR
ncbi:hypothetical protein EYZ11_004904 [Aspergillus tanneri]|uniref:DUF6604 domain-containing protein n=1 Tax=Aspergillus tanneri TaxID=1220188 RepID=A0A4S3JJ66_9EURO|nr:hypothetical protein EYZ11_004904 [Aspergillus tanneri]